ncbi:uncharacterized protein V1513DRAFT_440496 [Lipomyces chichibuensis]|uniref:uncharacterized protein n=1 Tax=Lipomyces chichibuensis TaxID=1546026 RepID=UPI0033438DCD
MSPGVVGNITNPLKVSSSSMEDNTIATAPNHMPTSPPSQSTTVSSKSDINPLYGPEFLDNSPKNTQLTPGLNNPPLSSVPETATFVESNHVPQKIKQFVDEKPGERYIFDGDDRQTKLCRFEEDGRKCLNLAAPTKDVLSQMQKLDFYCALGQDIRRSEIECRKIL